MPNETPQQELARLLKQREETTDSQVRAIIDRRIEVLRQKLRNLERK
jgi:hypothetical protein